MAAVQTYSGRFYDLVSPTPDQFALVDIAHHLSQLCRFGGATLQPYSVAQHSLVVSYLVPPEHALEALLHDAPEAYLSDLPAPLKWVLGDGRHRYEDLTRRAEILIAYCLGVPESTYRGDEAVKYADVLALRHESTVWLAGGPGLYRSLDLEDDEELEPWCAPLRIEPSSLIHPFHDGSGYAHIAAEELLYTCLTPARARLLFLHRLVGLARAGRHRRLEVLAHEALAYCPPPPPPLPAYNPFDADDECEPAAMPRHLI